MVIFNEGLCKIAEQYLKKGSKVYLEGALQTRKWQDKDGHDRYSTEVVLQGFNSQLTMLDTRGGGGGGAGADNGDDFGSQRPDARRASASRRWPAPAASATTWTTRFRSEYVIRQSLCRPQVDQSRRRSFAVELRGIAGHCDLDAELAAMRNAHRGRTRRAVFADRHVAVSDECRHCCRLRNV